MKFETTNDRPGDSDAACLRRWQQVLDLGCPAAQSVRPATRATEPVSPPVFEVLP